MYTTVVSLWIGQKLLSRAQTDIIYQKSPSISSILDSGREISFSNIR